MRVIELLENLTGDINLYGKTINRRLITKELPSKWDGPFDCAQENLTSLEGCPEEINGDMWCFDNHLTSLKYSPRKIIGAFDCSGNQLTNCIGAPDHITKKLLLAKNSFKHLKNIHKQLKYVGNQIDLSGNEITSHVLGLLLIEGVRWVYLDTVPVAKILNKYLPNHDGNQGVMECQRDLIDAGYPEFAKL